MIRLPEEVNALNLMRTKGGGLGLLGRSCTNYKTQLWKRKSNCDGVAPWVLGRTIDLEKILSLKPADKCAILGLAEDNSLLLLWAITGLVLIHL